MSKYYFVEQHHDNGITFMMCHFGTGEVRYDEKWSYCSNPQHHKDDRRMWRESFHKFCDSLEKMENNKWVMPTGKSSLAI